MNSADKVFSTLGSIIILATVTVILTSKNTVGVTTGLFSGVKGLISTAMGNK